jgi:hypothetical protein
MKFKPTELRDLINASYKSDLSDVGKFKIDSSISNPRVKVYTIEGLTDVIVTHRGSEDSQDWVDNGLYSNFNILKSSRTYKLHLQRHKKAVKKYGFNNIIVMGHSRGGLYATQIYKDKYAKQLVTYNKPVSVIDVSKNVLSKKEKKDKEIVDIRTSRDLVSVGSNLLLNKKNNLKQLDDDNLIGTGIFKQKTNYSKIRKNELKNFVKINKKKLNLDINITGLTKKDLILIVESIQMKH